MKWEPVMLVILHMPYWLRLYVNLETDIKLRVYRDCNSHNEGGTYSNVATGWIAGDTPNSWKILKFVRMI